MAFIVLLGLNVSLLLAKMCFTDSNVSIRPGKLKSGIRSGEIVFKWHDFLVSHYSHKITQTLATRLPKVDWHEYIGTWSSTCLKIRAEICLLTYNPLYT